MHTTSGNTTIGQTQTDYSTFAQAAIDRKEQEANGGCPFPATSTCAIIKVGNILFPQRRLQPPQQAASK